MSIANIIGDKNIGSKDSLLLNQFYLSSGMIIMLAWLSSAR